MAQPPEALERALAVLAEDRAPAALRARVALIAATAHASRRRSAPLHTIRRRSARLPTIRRRSAPVPAIRRRAAGALAAALTATTALAASLALLGAGAAQSVADAVALATRPAVTQVHPTPGDHATLPGVSGAGLWFPYWEDRFGWTAVGFRRDQLDGRTLSTVFYVRGGHRLAYTIVSGPRLPGVAGARATVRAGIRLETTPLTGRTVATWLRHGHTCVLSATGVSPAQLVALAAWRAGGALAY
jgi:hypothetical protein